MILATLLTLLQLFDGWTTYQILVKHGGREKNPVMVWLFEMVGNVYGGLLLTKAFAIVLIWVLYLNAPFYVLLVLAIAYLWVAVNNWKVLKRLRGN